MNLPLITHFATTDLQKRIRQHSDLGAYIFNGFEYFTSLNSGLAGAALYFDSFAWCDHYYQIRGGKIEKIH